MQHKPLSTAQVKVGRASPEVIETSHNRLLVVMIVFTLAFVSISLRVFEVSLLGGGETTDEMDFAEFNRPYERADIVDRNGVLLVSNLVTASLYANPKVVLDAEEAVQKLVNTFPDLEKEVLRERLASNRSFVWIKRNLTPVEQYQANSLGLPGLYFEREETRVYPHENLLSHVLGFVDVDGHGLSGIEKQFDGYLSDKKTADPLRLSIDVRVQEIVHRALLAKKEEYNATAAVALVMDVYTGEIISLVSLPDFDPNNSGKATAEEKFNRATLGVYEMGSTFKIFNTALALESGKIKVDDVYDVSTPIRVASFNIRDFHPKKGLMTVPEIFMYSSNIGSARMATQVGGDEQRQFLRTLGLLDGLQVEIPEKSEPLYPSHWGKISTMTISYGHGIAVTPMHIVKATSALVNGGVLHPSTLLHKQADNDIRGVRVVSEETSDAIRRMLRLAVEYGTGGNGNASSYLVGGKTGSADKVSNGNYKNGGMLSSFVAAFPMNRPQYAVMVMVDEPQSKGGYVTGGVVAAPVVKEIVSKAGPVLGVQPVDENEYEIRREFWYDNEPKEPKIALAEPV